MSHPIPIVAVVVLPRQRRQRQVDAGGLPAQHQRSVLPTTGRGAATPAAQHFLEPFRLTEIKPFSGRFISREI